MKIKFLHICVFLMDLYMFPHTYCLVYDILIQIHKRCNHIHYTWIFIAYYLHVLVYFYRIGFYSYFWYAWLVIPYRKWTPTVPAYSLWSYDMYLVCKILFLLRFPVMVDLNLSSNFIIWTYAQCFQSPGVLTISYSWIGNLPFLLALI